MSGASQGGLMMLSTKILHVLVCAHMVSTLLGFFIFTPSCCSCTSLLMLSFQAGKLQAGEGFKVAQISSTHEEVVEQGPQKLDIISNNQKLGAKKMVENNMMREILPRKLMQNLKKQQKISGQSTKMMMSSQNLLHHKEAINPAKPIYEEAAASTGTSLYHKVTIKPAQSHEDHSSEVAMYQEAITKRPSQLNGVLQGTGNAAFFELEATIKPAQEEDDDAFHHAASIEVAAAAHSYGARMHEDAISPAVLQIQEEFHRRGRALHIELLETRQRAEMRAAKYHTHDNHFHADYVEPGTHPPRNN